LPADYLRTFLRGRSGDLQIGHPAFFIALNPSLTANAFLPLKIALATTLELFSSEGHLQYAIII